MGRPRGPRFDDGTYAGSDFADKGRRVGARKTMQLCTQVRRALELILMEAEDELLEDVEVDEVVPTQDPGRLMAMFVAGERAARAGKAEVAARLEALRPAFVDEIAQTIHRRKVPELAFEVVKRVGDS